ncbi:MAG: type I restriction-modification system subunit M [Bacteroidaceae bacterium]|nr:type I restriction-modification system subunit M [Bacteroidaceae bacterium]
MNKQQLAHRIFNSCNKMRNKIEANEYKDYILGLIFYKFLSDTEVKYFTEVCEWEEDELPELVENYEDLNMKNAIKECQERIGFFIEYKYLFSTWLNDTSFSVQTLSEALSNFERLMSENYASVYDGIFKTLREGLSKLGDNPSAQTKALKGLIKLIKIIPTDGSQDYDVLGYVYEYLISNFAANAGKKAGEFYTPHEVAKIMSEIVAEHHKNKESLEIYDPTSGSGSLLITIGKAVSKYIQGKNRVKYYAQELKENTYNLTRMNLVMRGIIPQNIVTRCADTLEEDWPIHEEGSEIDKPLAVDAVVSNPPYSQHWDPKDMEYDPRFKNYGVAPRTKADYAFLLHELHHLKGDGIMTIVMPHGVLFRGKAPKIYDKDGNFLPLELQEEGQAEGKIRANLIEKNNIDAIIGLPSKIFFGTGIPTLIMVLKKNRGNEGVLIIDASKGFVKDGKQNKLRACDVKKIADTYRERKEIPGFSRVVTRDEIRKNEYNLNIPRYVDSSEAPVKYDIYATMFGGLPNSEIADFREYWDAFPSLQQELFAPEQDKPYFTVKVADIVEAIHKNSDVKDFKARFATAFEDFKPMLHTRLIDNVEQLKEVVENDIISTDIFRRCEGMPLIDKYAAYQILADNWSSIMGDVEIIQSEGFGACNVVEPRMKMVKDKNGDEQEIEDGLKGRIIPFELVQEALQTDELAALNQLKQAKEEQDNMLTELLGNLDMEEQDLLLNDDNTAYDKKNVNDAWKQILKEITMPETELLEAYLKLSKKSDKLTYIEDNPSDLWGEMTKAKDGTFAKKTVTAIITQLKSAYEFEEDSTEYKVKSIVLALEKSSELAKKIKEADGLLEQHTIETIQSLDMKQTAQLLELKWIKPITTAIEALPDSIIQTLADSIKALREKYAVTYNEIEQGIEESESNLVTLIDQLTGDEFAISGLSNLIKK